MIDPEEIRAKAVSLGFSACGFARAEALPLDDLYNSWLEKSCHGTMKFLERNKSLRFDPIKLFPGTSTVIMLAASYFTESYKPAEPLKVSRYAVGRDYHRVLKKMGQGLIDWIDQKSAGHNARVFVDSAPIMEKEWARKAGLGWIGKNTCLIMPGEGSWFFLTVILSSLDIKPDPPENRDLCGKCTKCIDACPTLAIHADGFLDARKCLSYLTIEYKGQIPDEFKGKTENWLFGCDRCQEVCPHNRFAREMTIKDFEPRNILSQLAPGQLSQMENDEFERHFAGSPIKRAGLEKLKNTSAFLFSDD